MIDPALNGDELPLNDGEDDVSALLQELSAEEDAADSSAALLSPAADSTDVAVELEEAAPLSEPAPAQPLAEAAPEAVAPPAEPVPAEESQAPESPEAPEPPALVTVPQAPTDDHEVVAAGFDADRARVSPWPFVIYDLLWAAFAGVLTWQLLELPSGTATYEAPVYPLTIYAGLALTLTGPVLALGVWLVSRRRSSDRAGMFTSALLMGSAATTLGVIVWWAALLAVDYVRLGRLF